MEESRRDALVLARAALGWDEARWIADQRESAPREFTAKYDEVIERRRKREPVAYILGEREFYGRMFQVTPAVLIPRPETELLVDAALAAIPAGNAGVVDAGTGSGCLAITLALECPDARVVATDVSPAALAVAKANAERHGVADRVEFLETDLLRGAPSRVDVIVSNPPYVPERDRSSLAPEVLDFEPSEALFSGPEGLDTIRRLVPAALPLLSMHGVLVIEFGWGQVDAVAELIQSTQGFALHQIHRDLQNIPRVAVAMRDDGPVR